MHVRRLQLSSFRNYRELDLTLTPGNFLFLGDNAQGKSNLLEAVYLLATARSPRATADTDVISWQAESILQPLARVAATVERRSSPVQLEAVVTGPGPSLAGQVQRAGKRLRVNGIPRRAMDLVGQLRAVLFTVDDLDIISGSPSARRHYLDVTLSQLDRRYYTALQRYGRVLQQRNAALRRIRDSLAGADELTIWDDSLAREGAVIVAARLAATKRLAVLASDAHRELSGDAAEELILAYQPRLGPDWERLIAADASEAAVERLLAATLVAQRRRDLAAAVSLTGPHRDEILFTINGAGASFASRAQVRTATLALRLAEGRLLTADPPDPPVLLLDDILSELDERRRQSVLDSIREFDQVWFTATSAAGLPDAFLARSRVYQVRAGAVSAG